MSEDEIALQLGVLRMLISEQADHPLLPKIELLEDRPDANDCWLLRWGPQQLERLSLADAGRMDPEDPGWFLARILKIQNSELDRYEYGFWLPTWHENLWEMARLRVENAGEPYTFLCAGSNGSSKSDFAAAVWVRGMMQVGSLPRNKAEKPVFWCLSESEPKSVAVQQPKIYAALPLEYKTDKGSIKKTARGKLGWTDAGGFTDNSFSLYHGAICRFRFWSAKLDDVMEGPRPIAVWSDEEEPFAFMDGAEKRLNTEAELSNVLVPQLRALLKKKAEDPSLEYPLDKIWLLMPGLHLLTYTAKNGYTETVRAFMSGARIVQEIEADPELLPRRDREGRILGGERLPKLVLCKDKSRRVRFMHAWENPFGGNWKAMREKAKTKGRKEILWWCYGVAEQSANTPFPSFDPRIHVRPRHLLLAPKVKGTWYHAVDPNVAGGRQWFHLWAFVLGEHHRNMSPGDLIVAREWPQADDAIPGIGLPGDWALPGGKEGWTRGPAQDAWAVGLRFRADEIRRVEKELAAATGIGWADDAQRMKRFIRPNCRIMDSRAANTETENQEESTTLIEKMEDNGLEFVSAGRDSGAAQGETGVQPGEQMINDLFSFDREKATLNEATGWLEIDLNNGIGPKLYIAEECTNLIAAVQNYPGITVGGRHHPWKDPLDTLRYIVISRPEYVPDEAWEGWNPGGGY